MSSAPTQSKLAEEYEPRIFRFSVDENGNFSYEPSPSGDSTIPPATWAYNYESAIEFHCSKGPFTVRQSRIESAREDLQDPWGGSVTAVPDGKEGWVARPLVNDGLNEEERRLLWLTHHFITKNRYIFAVVDKGTILLDDSQTGVQSC